ncbi:hypothetical protein MMC07_009823 [Pseudocyphellaria aurata]|nr:hypothetical protein [Pseudocyphellaria aurata]
MRLQKELLFVALLPVIGSYAQLPATVTVTGSIPTPTASPLPPVNPKVQTLLDELATAIVYATLIANDNNLTATCALVDPPALSNITGINGKIVQLEVCSAAKIQAQNATASELVVLANQRGVPFLATALYAVQVAGNFAGGTDLDKLCSEIETVSITDLFSKYIDNFGTKIKNFVCNAAKHAAVTRTSAASSPSSTATEKCTSPTGFGNKVVPAPQALANEHFRPSPTFNATHLLFTITDPNIDLPEAVIARYCLDKCITYGGTRTCRSVFVNQGKPFPLGSQGADNAPRWYCSGFDAFLSANVYQKIDAPESYLYGLGINRACGTYRAY